jgi:hypothetical protein
MYGRFTNLIGQTNAGGSFLVDGIATIPSGGHHRFTTAGSHNVRTNNERFIDFGGSSDYKHHDWSQQPLDFRLTHSFTLTGDPILYIRDARFEEMLPTTIQAVLLDGGNPGGSIQIKDPWYLHSDGRQPDSLFTWPSPHSPTGAYNQTTGGVFLNQRYDVPNPVYYSVGAPSPNTFTIGGNNYSAYFRNWEGTSVQYQNAALAQTGVVFTNSNATAVAKCDVWFLRNSLNDI